MFCKSNQRKDGYMLTGSFAKNGYDWWWHSFTAYNAVTKEPKSFYIEFFIVNPALSPGKVIYGKNKDNLKPSYLMVNCGAWGKNPKQLHRFFALKEVSINPYPITISASDCFLSEYKTSGSISINEVNEEMNCDCGSISWDLSINKIIPFNVGYGTSKLFRDMKVFQMYWHAEGMKTFYEGEIIYEGEKYLVFKENCYGYADKNWGSDFTSPWVWLSSNHLISEKNGELKNSVFDIGGGRPKAFGISFDRKLVGAYFFEGKMYEYNFSKFWHHTNTFFSFEEKDGLAIWHVRQEDRKIAIETIVYCKREEMLFIKYEAPSGKMFHKKLYNCGNGYGDIYVYKKTNGEEILLDKIKCLNVGCEYGEYSE